MPYLLIFKKVYKSRFLGLYVPAIFAMIRATPVLAAEIDNPIAARNFPELILSISNALIPLASALAVVAIIFVGFKFLTASASGNEKALSEAKTMLWWVLIGTAVVVGASVIAEVVINTVTKLQ